MAIAFRLPEISVGAVAGADTTATSNANPSHQGTTHYTPIVHQQQSQFQGVTVQGTTTGGIVILSPSSAVIQHQGLWVSSSSPQSVVAQHQQQQMFSGFPPIYHNSTTTAAPQFHRVAYPVTTPPPSVQPMRTPLAPLSQPQQHRERAVMHRCVTGTGCCTTCNDIRRGKYTCLVVLFIKPEWWTSGSILNSMRMSRRIPSMGLSQQRTVINFRPFHLLCSVLVAFPDVVQRRLCSTAGTMRAADKEVTEDKQEGACVNDERGLEESVVKIL